MILFQLTTYLAEQKRATLRDISQSFPVQRELPAPPGGRGLWVVGGI